MVKQVRDGFVRVLLSPLQRSSIVALGIYTFFWGLWVAAPWWSVFDQAELFSTMGLIAPEVFWGGLAVACGASIIISAWKMFPRGVMDAAVITWAHWLMIAIFYFVGDWQNTGGITSLSIAIYAAFIYLNIKVNYYIKGKRKDSLFVKQ
jgi:hypothetical protein